MAFESALDLGLHDLSDGLFVLNQMTEDEQERALQLLANSTGELSDHEEETRHAHLVI